MCYNIIVIVLLLAIDENYRVKVGDAIRAVAKGDENALETLYRECGGKMYAVAYSITRHKQLSEDIVSEAFLRVVRYASFYKRNQNGYAWIMKITQNTAYNFLKSEKLRQGDDPDCFFALSDDFDAIAHTETTVMLEGAMVGLSDKEKQAVYMKYYLDLTVREIAQKTGVSKSEAARRVKSGEEKIKAYLISHGYDGK